MSSDFQSTYLKTSHSLNKRFILHLDMDSFYASVEAERHNLQGKPIVIGMYSKRGEERGAVSTTSYEARDLGIRSAMPLREARKIASNPELDVKVHFFPADIDYYSQKSEEIRLALREYSPNIEKASIDEFYLDITSKVTDFEEARQLSEEIKQRIKKDFNLTCSLGLAPNKLLAKIASDRNKPDGLTIVREEEKQKFLFSLDLKELYGIGSKTEQKLQKLGIESVKQLAQAREEELIKEFGEKFGPSLIKKAKGIDSSEVRETEQKQISRITTLKENSRDSKYLKEYLENLAQDLEEQLSKNNFYFQKVVLLTVDPQLKTRTKSTTLKVPSKDKEKILKEGTQLLEDFLKDFEGEIRRIGLRVGNLSHKKGQRRLSEF